MTDTTVTPGTSGTTTTAGSQTSAPANHGEATPTETPEQKAARETAAREQAAANEAAASRRTKAAVEQAKKEILADLQSAFGGGGPAPVTTDDLAATIKAQAEEIAAERRTNAVYRFAGEHNVDVALLMNLHSFVTELNTVDPTDPAAINDAIAAAAEKYPHIKKPASDGKDTAAAGKSGTDGAAGGAGEGTVSQEQFAAMSYTERVKLFEKNPELYRRLAGTA